MSQDNKNLNTAENAQFTPPRKKSGRLKEWLISLLITLIILGVIVAVEYWFANSSGFGINQQITWIGNAIGGVIMLLIVHHFIKKPKDDGYYQQ